MQQLFSDYDVWSFHQGEPGAWSWKRTSPEGDILLEGQTAFDNFDECMADAKRHGYSGSYSVNA